MPAHVSSVAAAAPVPPGFDTVALLLLAAGASTRMGQPKQLLAYRGRTLLRHAAETAVATGCSPLVLVTGAVHEALASEVAGLPFQVVHNSDWATGMASSIRTGLAAAEAARPAAVLIMLADQPLVTPALLRQLVKAQHDTNAPVVATAYGSTLGVPAVFAADVLPQLRQLRGAQGAGGFIVGLGPAAGRVAFAAGAIDVDTPEEYARLLGWEP